jgi:hypothetical protein
MSARVPELIPLANGWCVWRDVLVTPSELPAALLLHPPDGPDPVAALRAAASDERVRDALVWQGHGDAEGAALGAAEILDRACTKTDPMLFGSPVAWAAIERQDDAVACRAGARFVDREDVHFEHAAIDRLAQALAGRPGMRAWAAPRRSPGVRLDGDRLHLPSEAIELSPALAALLRACDGERTARAIAAELAGAASPPGPARWPDTEAVLAMLERWAEQGLILWSFELPVAGQSPQSALRAQLERIDDPALAGPALAALDALEEARGAVARAAGSADSVARTLRAAEQAVARTSGAFGAVTDPTDASGRVVYRERRRDVAVRLSIDALQGLGNALSLVLASNRWLMHEIAAGHRAALDTVYDELRTRTGTDSIPSLGFFGVAYPVFVTFSATGTSARPPYVLDAQHRFHAAWSRVLSVDRAARAVQRRSADLAAAVQAELAAPGPGWPTGRHQCVGLSVADERAGTARPGECTFVLDEIQWFHSFDVAWRLHPDPPSLLAAIARDLPSRVNLVGPKAWIYTRAALPGGAQDLDVECADGRSGQPRERTVALAETFVARADGRLVVRTYDGRRSWDILAFVDTILQHESSLPVLPIEALAGQPAARHVPRITIDDLVVRREGWRFSRAELSFAWSSTPGERLAGARRWADAHGLPRFIHARSAFVRRPELRHYVDLTSSSYVERLAEQIRADPEIEVTEMIPNPQQSWLVDERGRTCMTTLHLVAVDPLPWRAPR